MIIIPIYVHQDKIYGFLQKKQRKKNRIQYLMLNHILFSQKIILKTLKKLLLNF